MATRRSAGISAQSRATWRITHSPIGTTSPVSSAIETKTEAGTRPLPGSRQRSIAS